MKPFFKSSTSQNKENAIISVWDYVTFKLSSLLAYVLVLPCPGIITLYIINKILNSHIFSGRDFVLGTPPLSVSFVLIFV